MQEPKSPTDTTGATGALVRVMFLNTRDSLGADVAVHLLLARALDRMQTRVWVATSRYESPGASTRAALESIPDLTVLPIDLGRPLTHRGALRLLTISRDVPGIGSLVRLASTCRRERIDVIHVTERPRDALFGLLLARLAGSACLIHAHTGYYRHDASQLGNWILRRADAIVGVSRFTATTYARDAGLDPSRVFAVHNAVDHVAFHPDIPIAARLEVRALLGVSPDAPLIGCVARLSRWKDQASLLEALVNVRRAIPGTRLILAGINADSAPDGQGNYKDYLVRRIAAFGLDDAVTFAGFVPQQEMPNFYAALDVLAHPAVEEPFGLALVEAMASTRPVVAVGNGGVPEIIRDGIDGLLVPREQPEAMSAALIRVLSDPALAGRLANSGRSRVCEVFTPERQAVAMLGVYRRVVAVHHRRAVAMGTIADR